MTRHRLRYLAQLTGLFVVAYVPLIAFYLWWTGR